jgi:intracellular multiplication protein IcmP
MAKGGGGGGGGEPDTSMGPVWVVVAIFIFLALIWHFAFAYITQFVVTWRAYQLAFINIFIPVEWSTTLMQAAHFIESSRAAKYENASFMDLVTLSNQIGSYLRFPCAIILMSLGALIYTTKPLSRFKKTYNLQRLIDLEKENWPHLNVIAKLNLAEDDLNKGPWAMAMPPMVFAKHYKLLIEEKILSHGLALKNKATISVSVNRDEARKVFALQLGRYWESIEKLPPYMRALFAVFAARIQGDRDGAAKLLERINRSLPSGKPVFTGADELLNKHKDSKIVKIICEKHAFIITVMASMLEGGRTDGVIGCAEFMWLKPIDRRLWFMLNSVGRQTPFTEVAGVFAHWLAEKEFGRKLNVPMVEEAVNGLEIAVKEVIYKPDEATEE